jgi:hypothetical protein
VQEGEQEAVREDPQTQRTRASARPEGRAGHLTPEEKTAIRLEYLEHGGRMSRKAIAAKFRVNRDTVSECLKGPDFERLQKQFEQELREAAMRRLKAHVLPAADAWCNAVDTAAQRGDHRPARELLLHTGVIAPITGVDSTGVTVMVGGFSLYGMNIGIQQVSDFRDGDVLTATDDRLTARRQGPTGEWTNMHVAIAPALAEIPSTVVVEPGAQRLLDGGRANVVAND